MITTYAIIYIERVGIKLADTLANNWENPLAFVWIIGVPHFFLS